VSRQRKGGISPRNMVNVDDGASVKRKKSRRKSRPSQEQVRGDSKERKRIRIQTGQMVRPSPSNQMNTGGDGGGKIFAKMTQQADASKCWEGERLGTEREVCISAVIFMQKGQKEVCWEGDEKSCGR